MFGNGLPSSVRSTYDQLRSKQDPTQVESALTEILKQIVSEQGKPSSIYSKQSLKEIQKIRESLVSNSINAGNSQQHFVGMFTHVAENIQSQLEESSKSIRNDSFSFLERSIPSMDNLVGALIQANPILGFGVKVLKDYIVHRSESSKRSKEENERRLSVLQAERDYIESQMKKFDEFQKGFEPAEEQAESNERVREEVEEQTQFAKAQYEILESIDNEIKDIKNSLGIVDRSTSLESNDSPGLKLVGGMDFEDSVNDKLSPIDFSVNDADFGSDEDLIAAVNKTNSNIVFLRKEFEQGLMEQTEAQRVSLERMIDSDKEIALMQIAANEDLEEERRRAQKLDEMKGTEPKAIAPLEHLETKAVGTKKEGGLLSTILGALGLRGLGGGLLGGLVGGLGALTATSLFKPFKWLFSLLGGFGSKVGKFAKVLGAPIAVITSVYSFLDGFFNAEEIIKKKEGDISIIQRVEAGVASFVGAFAELVDTIFGFVGLGDLIETEGMTSWVYEKIEGFRLWVMDVYEHNVQQITDLIDGTVSVYQSMTQWFSETKESSLKAIDEKVQLVKDTYNGFLDSIVGIYTSLIESFNNIKKDLMGKVDGIKKSFTDNPVVKYFTGTPEEDVKETNPNPDYAGKDQKVAETLKEMYGTGRILYIGGGVASIMQTDSVEGNPDSKRARDDMRRQEQLAQSQEERKAPTIIAPSSQTNNVNNNTFTPGSGTSNPDMTFRNMM